MEHPMLKWFRFVYLTPELHDVAKRCAELADQMDTALPEGTEKTAGLRKLLEAQDCFVRAVLEQP